MGRKKRSAEEKAKIALEALREDKPLREIVPRQELFTPSKERAVSCCNRQFLVALLQSRRYTSRRCPIFTTEIMKFSSSMP